MAQILSAYAEARATKGKPTVILARTYKGKGVSFTEDKPNWHGKALNEGADGPTAFAELERPDGARRRADTRHPRAARGAGAEAAASRDGRPAYKLGDLVATREAYGTALAKLGAADPRVVALDADVKNSTFSERFEAAHPDRFYQFFIAEQVMVGAAMGLAARGAIPFPSTFAAFLTRAADFIRMAAISGVNIKLAGSHAGVSIGEDGPSQMALEDFAMFTAQPNFTVLYPCDAVCAERLVGEAADASRARSTSAPRGRRPRSSTATTSSFPIGGLKVLRAERQGRGHGDRRRRDAVRGAQGLRRAEGRGHRDPRDRPLLHPADRRRVADRSGPRRPAAASSRWKTTTWPAASAMRWRAPWRRPASP